MQRQNYMITAEEVAESMGISLGYALEVKNGRITWSKNMKTNKITRPGSKKSTVKTKKLKGT